MTVYVFVNVDYVCCAYDDYELAAGLLGDTLLVMVLFFELVLPAALIFYYIEVFIICFTPSVINQNISRILKFEYLIGLI